MLILGQGLAGTLLAWELERNGADFQIVDAGHGPSASRVAAGIINPVTGQRLVKSWRIDTLLPLARAVYRDLERQWGVTLWREMRVWRRFANETERRIWREKRDRGELEPYGGTGDQDGFWIEGAAHVDVGALLLAARAHWRKTGRLCEATADLAEERRRHELVVVCTGAALRSEPAFDHVPWTIAKGELLTVETSGLAPDVILNHGHWVLPTAPDEAKVGATYARDAQDLHPTAAARVQLEDSARTLLRAPFVVRRQDAGLRLTLPDKCPVAGRSPRDAKLGVLAGLGSKGVLLAPWLARQWWNHLSEGVPFDPQVDVARFRP